MSAGDQDRVISYRQERFTPYLFLIPYLLAFVIFRFGPTLAGFAIGLFRWNILGTPRFIGIDNYSALALDPAFHTTLKNSFYFVLLATPALIALGLLLAILVNQKLRGRTVARTVIFAPYVVMSTVVGTIWLWIFNRNVGILNYYLSFLGIKKIAWLSSTTAALPAVAIATIWWMVGFNMIIYLAGLQDIPEELEDAARVDGASEFGVFRHITLPLLAPTTFLVSMLTLINTLQVFGQIYVMTNGGPALATTTMIIFLYSQAFQNYRLGYGSAVAFVVLVILVILALVQRRLIPEQ